MPRANRYRLAGHVWHLTQRCHRKQFLLKFARDRRAWVRWLSAARQRYGLSVLNYQVTSNHVHVFVLDRGTDEIAPSMQLIAGCVGRAYNRRQRHPGAFWEDCYQPTGTSSTSPSQSAWDGSGRWLRRHAAAYRAPRTALRIQRESALRLLVL